MERGEITEDEDKENVTTIESDENVQVKCTKLFFKSLNSVATKPWDIYLLLNSNLPILCVAPKLCAFGESQY